MKIAGMNYFNIKMLFQVRDKTEKRNWDFLIPS